MTRRRFDWTSTRWMSTRQKPLPASCVYFDRQRFALGLPRIAQGLDRLDSSSLSVSTGPPTLLPDVIDIDGPVPAGGETAGLLRSAEQVWAVSWPAWTPTISISSSPSWGMPAAAGRHVIPQMTPQGSGCDD